MYKLNPDLFKDTTPSSRVGDLGYPYILRYGIFKVESEFLNDIRGEMVACSIKYNKHIPKGMFANTIYLLKKDLIST